MYNRLKPIKSNENEGKMGVVNLHRKEGGHVQPDLGGQYHRILHWPTSSLLLAGYSLTMTKIKPMVAELNKLCTRYLDRKEIFNEHTRIKELFLSLKTLGYRIVTVLYEADSPESELLSGDGLHELDKLLAVRRMKMEAIRDQEFERAADMRDSETKLERKVRVDLFIQTERNYFFLSDKVKNEVIFNDPENQLGELFK